MKNNCQGITNHGAEKFRKLQNQLSGFASSYSKYAAQTKGKKK